MVPTTKTIVNHSLEWAEAVIYLAVMVGLVGLLLFSVIQCLIDWRKRK